MSGGRTNDEVAAALGVRPGTVGTWLARLRGASFASTEQLSAAIAAFIAAYNDHAAPFVWRKRGVKGS